MSKNSHIIIIMTCRTSNILYLSLYNTITLIVFFMSLLFVSLTAGAVVDTITDDVINYCHNDHCDSRLNNIEPIRVEVSFLNATMTRIKTDDSICVNWTAISRNYDEQYNASILQYHQGTTETLMKKQTNNYFDTIQLKLPPKYLTSLCDDDVNTTTIMEDWWNSTMENIIYNDSVILHGENCNSDSFYDDAFFVRPLHRYNSSEYNDEYSNDDIYYCSLSVILSNVQKVNNNIVSLSIFNGTAPTNKTRTIILDETLVTKDDIEYITIHNIHLLDHIQIVLVPYTFFIHIDNEIQYLQTKNIDLMSPYYMDPLSIHWNLTYEFMEIINDSDDGIDNIANGTILSNTLSPQQTVTDASRTRLGTSIMLIFFSLVSCLLVILMTATRNQLAGPPDLNIISEITTNLEAVETKPVQSIEDRKHDFDTLPKIHYHHNSCTLSKRRLMSEDDSKLQQVENSSSSTETETFRNDNDDNVDVPFGNYNRTDQEVNNDVGMMIRHDNQEHTASHLETMPSETIICNDIENVQENEAEDIITDTTSNSTDDLRNSLKRFSLVYMTSNINKSITSYDDEEDINNHFYHEECPICFDRYEPDEIVILLPQCHHMYHISCLEEWFMHRKSNLCPLCKTPIIVDIESSISL